MPANLNALIRYKTINSCLSGGRRRWSIDELRERCSEALAENRGRYTGVSERTLRDDIRVMRSDILGFNAPIKQEGGLYFYSDPGYSILSLRITDEGLGDQILELLMKMRGKVNHPEMEIIMKKLCRMTGREYEYKERIIVKKQLIEKEIHADEILSADMDFCYDIEEFPMKTRPKRMASTASRMQLFELSWGEIIAAVMA
ncbi:MAG: hypothetical protein GX622_13785 [Bacteroidales bacterium]|nr:hypothetical protein [Bacteroidales bacterium]